MNQKVLHAFISSADEHSCYFLAECLRRGKLFVETPPLSEFFSVVHVGNKGGKWFSVYPPGWPLIWSFGLRCGISDWLNPAMSALSLVFFYFVAKKLFSRSAAGLGFALTALSPFFLFTGASYFSHGTCLLAISVFLWAFVEWQRTESETGRVVWAGIAAFAVGYGLMTRYLTMAAVAGPFLLYHFLHCLEHTGRSSGTTGVSWVLGWRLKLRRSEWVFVSVVLAFMLLILWQNYQVSGTPLKAPNKYDKSWERLGFKRGHYTPVDGFFYLLARIFYLMDWFAPPIVGAYLFLIFRKPCGLREDKRSRFSLQTIFSLTPVFLALAYFLYYSWGGNQWGPRYWWEGMPFLAVAVADRLVRMWRERGVRVQKFILVFIAASFASSGILFAKHAEFTEEASRQRRALYDAAVKTTQGPAIVFIKGFLGDKLVMSEDDAVRNSPFLNGPILYAHDLGPRNGELKKYFPDRTFYRGTYDREKNRAVIERIV